MFCRSNQTRYQQIVEKIVLKNMGYWQSESEVGKKQAYLGLKEDNYCILLQKLCGIVALADFQLSLRGYSQGCEILYLNIEILYLNIFFQKK